MARAKKSDAPRLENERRGVLEKIPAATYSPTRKPCSTIGSGGLNFRVRDGNGWNPSDKATGNLCAPLRVKQRALHMRKSCWRYCILTALDLDLRKRSERNKEEKNDQAARAISIGQLNALRRLHLRPIDVVVFDGSSGDCSREA